MLGDTVREARIRKGLTQARLARLAGVSRRHLAALEKGANVSVNVLRKVAAVLELTEIQLGDDMALRGNAEKSTVNMPLLTDTIREAREEALRAQAILERADRLLSGGEAGNGIEVRFPKLPVRRLEMPENASSGDVLRDRSGWPEITTKGEIRQGHAVDEASAETLQVPPNLLDDGEVVFRARGNDFRDHNIEDGDLLIVELRPRGRAANGELVIGQIGKQFFVGRWWQKHGRKALMSDGLSEVTVGRSARSLKVVAAINQIVRGY
ncbi:MAG TPA: helix-turn-helix domain-containing protein [Thermoanaerobaculia bacterium]|nr:helix-turn-helix domain-containing protein [Thermoanaerobaculia bacterium]